MSATPAPRVIDGPPPPVDPEVESRDNQGHATIRAVRIAGPLKIDGKLDEEMYQEVRPIGGFIQQEPHEGEPITERTEAWVFFDDTTLYVAARCWDSRPEREIANELRRDMVNISNNDNFVVILDTFYDRRNGFYFQTSPVGALRDLTITDEGNPNESWNTIWYVKPGRFDGGWTMEMAIPFKSLRYGSAGPQVWGINFRRTMKWKNENAFLTRVPNAYGGLGIFYLSVAGTLVGLEAPASSRNLELKPYLASSITTDRTAAVPTSNEWAKNVGFDFKYGLTRGLIADATYNTDFAQIEEDLQQVNLTRFSLFFPEKRDFFLEGQGVYAFGGAQLVANPGALPAQLQDTAGDVPIVFFSRQIGLLNGQALPVIAGGRLTGTMGRYSIGALNIETDDKPSAGAVRTNFAALRIKRNILRKSNVGVIATRRGPSAGGVGDNIVMGADANLNFYKSISVNSYFVKTRSDGLTGHDMSYRTRFDYNADRYGLAFEEMMVGDNFNPEIGFRRRHDFARNYALARFSPRPKNSRVVRRFTFRGSFDYVTNGDRTQLENRTLKGNFLTEFQNSDNVQLEHTHDYEFLPQDFHISPGVVVPTGGYTYQNTKVTYLLGQQHRVSGTASLAHGSFYGGGTKTELNFSAGRGIVTSRFSIEPGLSLNWVDLPFGDFSTGLWNARIVLAPTPRMAISSLLQFNALAHTLNSSVRLRWEYIPGSELFLVYSDGRNALVSGVPELMNRTLAFKVTRLLRF